MNNSERLSQVLTHLGVSKLISRTSTISIPFVQHYHIRRCFSTSDIGKRMEPLRDERKENRGNDIYQRLEPSLKQIRLLKFLPKSQDRHTIACEIQVTNLSNQPKYEALSYCWGDPNDCKDITIGNHRRAVTKNLYDALTAVRRDDEHRILWVDALCINQVDLDERSQQVALMRDIYQGASRVLVWLGEDKEKIAPQVLFHGNNESAHFPAEDVWKHFRFVLSEGTAWWKRAWTAQEAIHAAQLDFHLGETCLSFDDLQAYTRALSLHLFGYKSCCDEPLKKVGAHGQPFEILDGCVSELAMARENTNNNLNDILSTLDQYKTREASDLRDKVFAFAGLANNVPDDLITYRLPLKQTLVHSARTMISRSSGLDLLRYVESNTEGANHAVQTDQSRDERGTPYERHRMDGLPSWCPDWTQAFYRQYAANQTMYKGLTGRFSAGTAGSSTVSFPSPDTLRCTGRICGIVQELETPKDNGDYTFPLSNLRNWRLLISTYVDACRPCDGCKRITWGPYARCRECTNFMYCFNCLQDASRTHPEHNFDALSDEESLTRRGPTMRRSLGAGKIVELEGRLCEMRQAVVSDLEPGLDQHLDVVFEPPWWVKLRSLKYPFVEGDSVFDAFRKCLYVDWSLAENCIAHPQIPITREWKNEYFPTADAEQRLENTIFTKFWHEEVEAITNFQSPLSDNAFARVAGSLVQAVTNRKNLFISDAGYIGLGPASVKAGDLICVLPGCRVPVILRRKESSSEVCENGRVRCTLIGEAYVHGLMYGEAFDSRRERSFARAEFDLL